MSVNNINLADFKIGHAVDEQYQTGCTVFLCPPETVGSVDARGPAPGSRELTLLDVDKPIQTVQAVLLTGGSAFGLAAADGVMRYLGERDIGHWTPIRRIPIVPAAVVYDLFFSQGQRMPDAEMGYQACLNASETEFSQGNVGVGTGVTVGKWGGREGFMKGGFGLACTEQEGMVVGAAAVVNAIGDVVNEDGSVLAGARRTGGGWLVDEKPYRPFAARPPAALTNTTLVVVWTNATLTKVEANRLAQRAHDALAIAIRPVHTTHDGDTAFALSTGQVEANFDLVANTAVHVTAEAIRNAVRFAHSVGEIPGLAE